MGLKLMTLHRLLHLGIKNGNKDKLRGQTRGTLEDRKLKHLTDRSDQPTHLDTRAENHGETAMLARFHLLINCRHCRTLGMLYP